VDAGNRRAVVGRRQPRVGDGCNRYLRLVYFVDGGRRGKSYTKGWLGEKENEYEQMQLYLSTHDPFSPCLSQTPEKISLILVAPLDREQRQLSSNGWQQFKVWSRR
jgi:hypothetical protein